MKISVITATENRSKFLPGLYDSFKRQSWVDRELVVLDSSIERDTAFLALIEDDTRVRYIHAGPAQAGPLTAANKRYKLVEAATGEFIAHFNDSDYYAPLYLQRHLEHLDGADLVTLRSWYSFQVPERFFSFWKTYLFERTHFEIAAGKLIQPITPFGKLTQFDAYEHVWGHSFCQMYKRSAALSLGYPAGYLPEDYEFFREFRSHGFGAAAYDDNEGLFLHFLHGDESKPIYPQYHFQSDIIVKLFGSALVPYLQRIS